MAWYRPEGAMRPDGTYEYFTYSRAFIALFALVDLGLAGTGRMLLRSALRRRRLAGGNLQRILVVGAGALGREITGKLVAHRELGIEVVGFLDDDPNKLGKSFAASPSSAPRGRSRR
jgi:FlaA1/EpsC-like NDP-sugar epimerase